MEIFGIPLETIIGVLLTVLAMAVPGWLTIRKKIVSVTKELADIIETAGLALEDNKVTKEELDKILKEYKELKDLFKNEVDPKADNK